MAMRLGLRSSRKKDFYGWIFSFHKLFSTSIIKAAYVIETTFDKKGTN